MANRSDNDYQKAPCLFRTYAGGTARALDSTDAPVTAQHLPCAVLIQVSTAGHTFQFKDASGTANTLLFKLTGSFYLRMAPLTFETGGTADSGDFVTFFWQPAIRV